MATPVQAPVAVAANDAAQPDPGTTPTGKPEELLSPWPGILAFLLFGVGMGALSIPAVTEKDFGPLLNGGIIVTALYFGFLGFRYGGLRETFWLGRFAAALGLAYWFCEDVGKLLGFPNILGKSAGFSLTFATSFLVLNIAFMSLFRNPRPPTRAGSIIGMLLGFGEAILLFSVVGMLLSYLPSGQVPLSNSLTSGLGQHIEEKLVQPYLAANASGPMALVAVAREAKGGFDPRLVDQRVLQKQFHSLAQHPKIRAIGEDPEIQEMAQGQKFTELIRHPKITGLLADPELQKIGEAIDWDAVAAALRQGIKTGGHPTVGNSLPAHIGNQ